MDTNSNSKKTCVRLLTHICELVKTGHFLVSIVSFRLNKKKKIKSFGMFKKCWRGDGMFGRCAKIVDLGYTTKGHWMEEGWLLDYWSIGNPEFSPSMGRWYEVTIYFKIYNAIQRIELSANYQKPVLRSDILPTGRQAWLFVVIINRYFTFCIFNRTIPFRFCF